MVKIMGVYLKYLSLLIYCGQIQSISVLDLLKLGADNRVGLEQIKFYFYPRANDRRELHVNDGHSIAHSDLKEGAPTVIIFDGFRSNGSTPMLVTMPNSFVNHGGYGNVIVMDWGSLSGFKPNADNNNAASGLTQFFQVIAKIEDVGTRLADFVNLLRIGKKIPFSDVHLVGLSLGAHIAGITGKLIMEQYGGQIGRITGLDPATTLIPLRVTKLRKGAAGFIDIYHTNRGLLGELAERTGDINIYVNGGTSQPGCEDRDFSGTGLPGLCSHTFAWQFFDATFKNDFHACPCFSIKCYCQTECNRSCTEPVRVGINIPFESSGSYHVSTKTLRTQIFK